MNAAGAVVVLLAAPKLSALGEAFGVPQALAQGLGHGLAIVLGAAINFLGHRTLTFAGRAA